MFDKVKAIFEEQLGVSQDEMQLDTNFKDDLGVDSLDLYEIVMKMNSTLRSLLRSLKTLLHSKTYLTILRAKV